MLFQFQNLVKQEAKIFDRRAINGHDKIRLGTGESYPARARPAIVQSQHSNKAGRMRPALIARFVKSSYC
jgi:hypothetical protein